MNARESETSDLRAGTKMYMKFALVMYCDLLNNRPTKVKIGALFHQKED
jgi:hypothetical protein